MNRLNDCLRFLWLSDVEAGWQIMLIPTKELYRITPPRGGNIDFRAASIAILSPKRDISFFDGTNVTSLILDNHSLYDRNDKRFSYLGVTGAPFDAAGRWGLVFNDVVHFFDEHNQLDTTVPIINPIPMDWANRWAHPRIASFNAAAGILAVGLTGYATQSIQAVGILKIDADQAEWLDFFYIDHDFEDPSLCDAVTTRFLEHRSLSATNKRFIARDYKKVMRAASASNAASTCLPRVSVNISCLEFDTSGTLLIHCGSDSSWFKYGMNFSVLLAADGNKVQYRNHMPHGIARINPERELVAFKPLDGKDAIFLTRLSGEVIGEIPFKRKSSLGLKEHPSIIAFRGNKMLVRTNTGPKSFEIILVELDL